MVMDEAPSQRADSSNNIETSTGSSGEKHSRHGSHAHQSTMRQALEQDSMVHLFNLQSNSNNINVNASLNRRQYIF